MIQTAVLRLLIDLIKADAVIDSAEMDDFIKMKEYYRINNSHSKKTASLTLSEAMAELKSECDKTWRHKLIDDLKEMTLVDGYCVKKEAQLLTAIDYCLSEQTKDRAEVISVNVPDISIAEDQVVYIDSGSVASFDKEILNACRHLSTEFKCAGLNFFYIPKVAQHYRETDPSLFKNVCEFLAPGFGEEEIDEMVKYISEVTTKKFCKEQLFGKLGMSLLYNTKPGLLFFIGTSFVDDKLYNNFLKIEFVPTESVCKQIMNFIDLYTGYLSYDVVVIPKADDVEGHFLYGGFYKFVYDLYLYKNPESSRLVIDTLKESISFPDLGRDFDMRVSRKEKAVYVFMLLESLHGGVGFSATNNFHEDEKRRKVIARKFRSVYLMMGGRPDSVPDINDETIRRPAFSHINKFFDDCSQIITNHDDFKIKRKNGMYYIAIDNDMLMVRTPDHHEPIGLIGSELLGSYNASE